MTRPDVCLPHENPGSMRHLWDIQLADYRTLLRLAQEEAAALQPLDLDILWHTQTHREHVTQRILDRARLLEERPVPEWPQDILPEVTATIAAIMTLDRAHQRTLVAEQHTLACLLQKLKEDTTALQRYQPRSSRPWQFLNGTI